MWCYILNTIRNGILSIFFTASLDPIPNPIENEIGKTDLVKKTDIDITLETAPTWDFLNQFLNEVAIPISDMSHSYMKYKYPKLIRFMKWKYRNRLEKIRKVWLSNELTGENFAKFKSYRLFLFKK